MAGKGDKRRPMTIPRDQFDANWGNITWGEPEPADFKAPLPDPLAAIPAEETKEMFLSESKEVAPPEDFYVEE